MADGPPSATPSETSHAHFQSYSPLTFGSISTHGGSEYSRLRTPDTPIMTGCFVDSPADGGFQTFRSLISSREPSMGSSVPRSASPADKDGLGEPYASEAYGSSSRPPRTRQRPSPLDLQGKAAVEDAPPTSRSSGSARSSLSTELEHLRRSVHQNLRDRPLGITVDSDSESATSPDRRISPSDALALIRTSSQLIVVDTRPLDDFLAAHVPRSAHIAIPSLMFNRLRRLAETGASLTWAALGPFVSTPASKRVWDTVDTGRYVDVLVVAADESEEDNAHAHAAILESIAGTGAVRVLRGGWAGATDLAQAEGLVVSGETSESDASRSDASTDSAHSLGSSSAFSDGAPAPSQTGSRGLNSLSHMRRDLPALSFQPSGIHTSPQPSHERKPPKLNLIIEHAAPVPRKAHSARPGRPKLGGLTIDVGDSRLAPASAIPARGSATPRAFNSFARGHPGGNLTPIPGTLYPPPLSGVSPMLTKPPPPLEVSTILPAFLYLGPEITTRSDVDTLLALGIRRVLNVAIECDDDEGLGLRQSFERYYRIPMKDCVEESGVERGIREACNILDDARLHSAPVYVHCKAGRSRSVTVVLAYLIHANAWTLKTSYAYVSERRQGISPNIGFVAELIQYEETELGKKREGAAANAPPLVPNAGLRYTRESLPPQWAGGGAGELAEEAMVEEHTPEARARRQGAADIEVRKNGQWVQGRRAPVDRTTLQPGRRVSKAGLESMVRMSAGPE